MNTESEGKEELDEMIPGFDESELDSESDDLLASKDEVPTRGGGGLKT